MEGGRVLTTTTTDSMTVLEAVGEYVANAKPSEEAALNKHSKQLLHFANWCGAETKIGSISPSKIGEYGQLASAGTQSPEQLQVVKKFLAFVRKQELTNHNLALHLRYRQTRRRAKTKASEDKRVDAIELTHEGHQDLLATLEGLKAQRGPIAEQIRRAAADKDVRENAPLEAAREQLGQVEARIQGIESTLAVAVVLDEKARSKSTVQIGSQVTLQELKSGKKTGNDLSFTLVSASEARAREGKVSDRSPVGRAVIGRREGDTVPVETPGGASVFRILKVS